MATYYQRCKQWANAQPEDEWGITDQLCGEGHKGRWDMRIGDIGATGKTQKLACKRLWETLVELGVAKEAAP